MRKKFIIKANTKEQKIALAMLIGIFFLSSLIIPIGLIQISKYSVISKYDIGMCIALKKTSQLAKRIFAL